VKYFAIAIGIMLFCVWLPWNISQVEKGHTDCEKKGGVLYHARGEQEICIDKRSVIK
jgi:hypothetical protein